MWLTLAVLSSFLLGIYDLFKKGSLRQNPFLPVLFLATSTGAIIFGTLVTFSRTGVLNSESLLYVPAISLYEHFLFFLKAIIVGTSWFFAYMALSNLPITIVVPIRSTGPIWTVTGALIIYHERFTEIQWIGIILAIISSYVFAWAGRKEGINFMKNKWIYAIVLATIIGSVSALYDKFLLQHYNRMAVQSWFSIYMVFVLLPFVLIMWYPKRQELTPFRWTWTIPAIGLTLSLADFLYFYALSMPESLIGVVSVLRRSSVIVAFILGALVFKETNVKKKAIGLIGLLGASIILILGS